MRILLISFLICSFGKIFAQNETYYNRVFDSVSAKNEQKNGITFFESELKKYPKNELILRSIGALNLQLGNFTETQTYYNKALVVNPSCAKCYFYIGQALANQNKWEEAFQSIEKGIGVDPKEGSLYLLRGKLKMYQGNEISGLNDLTKAILVDPNNVVYYIERADYYIRKKNYFSAKNDLLKGQKLDPKNIQVYNYLAQVYSYDNEHENALSAINKAIELDPDDTKSLLTRGEVYSMMQDYNHAIEDYKRVVILDPEEYHGYYYLAQAYYKQEKMDDFCTEINLAIQLIEKYQTADPAFYHHAVAQRKDVCDSLQSSYYYQRGIAQFNLNEPKAAIEFYNRGITKFPNEYMIYSFRGNAQLSLLHSREAISDYQNSLSHLDQVALELLKSSNYSDSKDSLELFSRAFKSSTYLSLAFCYFNLEKTDSALFCVDKSIEYSPDMKEYNVADAPFMRGILLLDKGKFKEAEKAFVKAAELAPDWSICKDYIAISLIAQVKSQSLSRNKHQIRQLADLYELHWTLPYKISKESAYFDRAMEQLGIAIRMNPSDYLALYLRAYVKRQIGILSCEDFKQANQMGYPVELEYLKACK